MKAPVTPSQSMKGTRSLKLTCQTIWIQVCFSITAQCAAWSTELAKGKSLLNLFCYTAAVSVQAALGGAKSTPEYRYVQHLSGLGSAQL